MDATQRKELQKVFEGDVIWDCPMDRYTTFRVGGPAEALCTCKDLPRLQWLMAFLLREGLPSVVLGNGSNVLVRDTGFPGVVVRLAGSLASLEQGKEGLSSLAAGGGATIPEMLSYCRERGWSGLEFLAGIPGTAGGAAAMNAGAWGREMSGVVQGIETVDAGGEVVSWDRPRLLFSYRNLSLPAGAVITKVLFLLAQEGAAEVSRRIHDYLSRRRASQPLDLPSAGSVFRNPPNDYAGRLIEAAGLKGRKIGGAMISPKHANFIVNEGGARAQDILALMRHVRETVLDRSGIELEHEIRVIG
ncbi:MAG: UDP-N-acetylmuramate dehydrogenase [Thermodesulfobacteriota bacterium]